MFGECLCLFWGFIYTEFGKEVQLLVCTLWRAYALWFAFSNVKCMREELIIWLRLCCRVDLEIGLLLFCQNAGQELFLCHILYVLKNKSMACSVRGVFSFPEHFKVEWTACLIWRAPRIEKHGPPFSQPRMLAVIWWKLQSTTFRWKLGDDRARLLQGKAGQQENDVAGDLVAKLKDRVSPFGSSPKITASKYTSQIVGIFMRMCW